MIKIGEFAKICGASTQTLRYYDAEGVLCADKIDNDTGYRYYDITAIEKYRKIVFYKELGFSLDEIKILMSSSEEQVREILIKKRSVISDSMNALRHSMAVIDGLCNPSEKKYSYIQDILNMPFENDPDAIGKWALCGEGNELDGDMSYSYTSICDGMDKEIVFLPNGAIAWKYFWTKNTLCRISPRYNFAIPNEYKISEEQGQKHMKIRFMTDRSIDFGEDCIFLIYKKVDSKVYTDAKIRARRDNTDLPFEADERVIGKWSVCDYIPDRTAFSPEKRYTADKNCYTREFGFATRGICVKTIRSGEKTVTLSLAYTRGFVLDDKEATAEKYCIEVIDNCEYLFVEHKSGDYFYGGMDPWIYVFKRKEKEL
ncbi:MAG: MerR family transcriptional regulator [Clostridia bacterium]|nr:MerR family transcriptional regulator [Clostridia bacterium]